MEDISDFDPLIIKSGPGVLFSLPTRVIDRVRRVVVRGIVSGTRYAPARALAALLCDCATNYTRPDMVGWYPYEFTTRDVYAVLLLRSKGGNTCPGSAAYGQIEPVILEGVNRMKLAAERV